MKRFEDLPNSHGNACVWPDGFERHIPVVGTTPYGVDGDLEHHGAKWHRGSVAQQATKCRTSHSRPRPKPRRSAPVRPPERDVDGRAGHGLIPRRETIVRRGLAIADAVAAGGALVVSVNAP